MSQEFHQLVVDKVIAESADSRSFVLSVPHGLRDRFRYVAGQFVSVELPWEGFHIRRCYSLSSAPGVDPAPQISVKRVAGGRMSNWLIDHIKPGDLLRVSAPEGRFVAAAAEQSLPLVLFAAGSGITPVLALLKAALHTSERTVSLLYANRDAASVMFDRVLKELAERFSSRFTYVQHLDDGQGTLSPAAVERFAAGKQDGVHYVCGPAGFMNLVQSVLEHANVPDARMHFERFVSPLDPDRHPTANDESAEPVAAPQSFTVVLEGKRHRVPLLVGQTLLEAAQTAGLRTPSSCESGYCGSCMAQCVRGDVRMRAREALTDRNIEQGRVLLCQAVAVSDAELEVDCDATSFRVAKAAGDRDQLALRRVVAAALVLFVTAAVWVLRTRG